MNTKMLMWVLLGLMLLVGGLVSSMRQGPATPPPPAAAPNTPSMMVDRSLVDSSKQGIDTGFTVDPAKGLRRKDANQDYFK